MLEIVKINNFSKTWHQIMKVNIFFRPEEAMLESWWKLVLYWNVFLFIEKIEPVSTLIMLGMFC